MTKYTVRKMPEGYSVRVTQPKCKAQNLYIKQPDGSHKNLYPTRAEALAAIDNFVSTMRAKKVAA